LWQFCEGIFQISYDVAQFFVRHTSVLEMGDNPWICSCTSQINDLVKLLYLNFQNESILKEVVVFSSWCRNFLIRINVFVVMVQIKGLSERRFKIRKKFTVILTCHFSLFKFCIDLHNRSRVSLPSWWKWWNLGNLNCKYKNLGYSLMDFMQSVVCLSYINKNGMFVCLSESVHLSIYILEWSVYLHVRMYVDLCVLCT